MKGALLVLPGVSIAKESNSAARDRSFEALHIGMEILIVFKNTFEFAQTKEHWTLEGKALRDFSKSETKRDGKKSYKYYLYVPKKYTFLPNEMGVASPNIEPHPSHLVKMYIF